MWAPITRILLRYGVGLVAGWQVGDILAGDTDVVDLASTGLSVAAAAATEWWYRRARQSGGET